MFVCLFVCYHLEPKLLDGSSPKLAWTSPLTLRRSSKNFFGGDPPRGGIILEKLKNPNFPKWPRAGGGILLRHLLRHLLRIFFWKFGYFLNGPSGARPVNGCEAARNQLVFHIISQTTLVWNIGELPFCDFSYPKLPRLLRPYNSLVSTGVEFHFLRNNLGNLQQ